MPSNAFALLRMRNPQASQMAQTMTGGQFQALRQLMLMTQAEAGAFLADRPVTERAVQYWEAGKRAIPEDAARSLIALVLERDRQMDKALAAIDADPTGAVVVWYRSEEDWTWRHQDLHFWKLHNSVAAAIFAAQLAELVTFDATAFVAWLREQVQQGTRMPALQAYQQHLEWAKSVAWGENPAPTAKAGN